MASVTGKVVSLPCGQEGRVVLVDVSGSRV